MLHNVLYFKISEISKDLSKTKGRMIPAFLFGKSHFMWSWFLFSFLWLFWWPAVSQKAFKIGPTNLSCFTFRIKFWVSTRPLFYFVLARLVLTHDELLNFSVSVRFWRKILFFKVFVPPEDIYVMLAKLDKGARGKLCAIAKEFKLFCEIVFNFLEILPVLRKF